MGFFIFDLIVLIVLILAVIQGYRKGFVLTLCGFLAVFVAFIGASILSDALAGPVSQAITPAIESGIQDTVGSYYQYTPPVEDSGDGSTPGDAFFDELPLEDVLAALQDSSLYRSLTQNFQQAVEDGVETVAANAVRALAEYVAVQLTRTVLFLLCFVLILAGWFVLSHALDLAFKLPVLSTLNQWSGAAVGLVKGGVLLFIACWLFQGLIPQEAVDQSILLRFFCTTNPFLFIASIF